MLICCHCATTIADGQRVCMDRKKETDTPEDPIRYLHHGKCCYERDKKVH